MLRWFSAEPFSMKAPELDISFAAWFFAAAGILLLPPDWLLSSITAAAIHETGHLLVLRWLKIPVHKIRVGSFGIRINTGPMTAGEELRCAAAGPVFSFGILLLRHRFPILALIGFIQGLFNLMPIRPMDGWRICRAMSEILRQARPGRKISCKQQHERVQCRQITYKEGKL